MLGGGGEGRRHGGRRGCRSSRAKAAAPSTAPVACQQQGQHRHPCGDPRSPASHLSAAPCWLGRPVELAARRRRAWPRSTSRAGAGGRCDSRGRAVVLGIVVRGICPPSGCALHADIGGAVGAWCSSSGEPHRGGPSARSTVCRSAGGQGRLAGSARGGPGVGEPASPDHPAKGGKACPGARARTTPAGMFARGVGPSRTLSGVHEMAADARGSCGGTGDQIRSPGARLLGAGRGGRRGRSPRGLDAVGSHAPAPRVGPLHRRQLRGQRPRRRRSLGVPHPSALSSWAARGSSKISGRATAPTSTGSGSTAGEW